MYIIILLYGTVVPHAKLIYLTYIIQEDGHFQILKNSYNVPIILNNFFLEILFMGDSHSENMNHTSFNL